MRLRICLSLILGAGLALAAGFCGVKSTRLRGTFAPLRSAISMACPVPPDSLERVAGVQIKRMPDARVSLAVARRYGQILEFHHTNILFP